MIQSFWKSAGRGWTRACARSLNTQKRLDSHAVPLFTASRYLRQTIEQSSPAQLHALMKFLQIEESDRSLESSSKSSGDVVFISGATGPQAAAINGAYDRTSEVCGGYALFAKRGDASTCIEHMSDLKSWQVKPVSDKGTSSCRAAVAGGCGLEACTSRVWSVSDGKAWNDASSVKLVAGAEAERQVRGGCLQARLHASPPQLQPAPPPPPPQLPYPLFPCFV